jgi:hypothetical protein
MAYFIDGSARVAREKKGEAETPFANEVDELEEEIERMARDQGISLDDESIVKAVEDMSANWEAQGDEAPLTERPQEYIDMVERIVPAQPPVPIEQRADQVINDGNKKRFRLQAKNISITYPRCYVSKHQCLAAIKKYFGDKFEWAVVAQELHKDGTPHLHVALQLHKKPDIRNCNALDLIIRDPHPEDTDEKTRFHPNFEKTKDVTAWLTYVVKADRHVLEEGCDVYKMIYQKSGKLDKIAMIAYDGHGDWRREIRVRHHGMWMMHRKKIEEIAEEGRLERMGPIPQGYAVIPLRDNIEPTLDCPRQITIPLGFARGHRQPQNYIHGDHGTGKTLFKERLIQAGFRAFSIPKNNDWAGWRDEFYSFAYIDEFRGECDLSVQTINAFLDGSEFKYNVKGSGGMKRHNVCVLIISNYLPAVVYKTEHQKRAIKEKRVMHINEMLDVDEGIEGFKDRVRDCIIDANKYDLFGAKFYDSNWDEIRVKRARKRTWCKACGSYKQKTTGLCHCDEAR